MYVTGRHHFLCVFDTVIKPIVLSVDWKLTYSVQCTITVVHVHPNVEQCSLTIP